VTPEQQPALDKIKKLLRMKRGGTQAEVETALNLARELAAKHGIDINSVNPDEQQSNLGHADEWIGARIQSECKWATLIVDTFFNVSALTNNGRITFVGTEWDRQIAIYVYRFLVAHFRREWKQRKGRCRNRQSFMHGMYCGLAGKLRDQQGLVDADGLAVIHLTEAARKRYIEANIGRTEKKAITKGDDAPEALYRGWVAGRET
jgi:hypothetical protein